MHFTSAHTSQMKLYTSRKSSAGHRLRIALNLKGIDYQAIIVDLEENNDPHCHNTALDPQQFLPALEINPDHIISQASALMEYLEEYQQDPPLLPKHLEDRVMVRSMAALIACDIQPLNSDHVHCYMQHELHLDAEQRHDWLQHWLNEGFHALDELVAVHGDGFCFGNSITMADIFLAAQWHHALDHDLDIGLYPNLQDVVDRLEKHPAFVKALEDQMSESFDLQDRQTMVMTMH